MITKTITLFDANELNAIDEVIRVYELPIIVNFELSEDTDEANNFVDTETEEKYSMKDGLDIIVEAVCDDDAELLDDISADDHDAFVELCQTFDIKVPLTPKERKYLEYLRSKDRVATLDKEEVFSFVSLEERE